MARGDQRRRHPVHLKKTVGIGLGVGTLLFRVNQLGVVIRGDATAWCGSRSP